MASENGEWSYADADEEILTRIAKAHELDGEVLEAEQIGADEQWARIVDLEIVAHPGVTWPKAVEADYAMTIGDVAAAVLCGEFGVGRADVGIQVGLQRGIDHPAADLRAGGDQGVHVLDVERGQAVVDALVQGVEGDELAEGVRRGGEAARDRDAQVGQLADHLAERGVLAADLGQVGQAEFVQPKDVGVQGCLHALQAAYDATGAHAIQA